MRFGYLRRQLFDEAGEGTGAGGGDGAVTLDAKAVQALIDKSLNGHSKRLETQFGAKFTEFGGKVDELMSKLGGGNKEGDKPGDNKHDGEVTPAVKAMLDEKQRKIDAMEKAVNNISEKAAKEQQKAEAAERKAALNKAIASLDLANKNQADDLYEQFEHRVKQDENGDFIVGDTTLESAIKAKYDNSPWLHPTVKVNGSGASANRSGKIPGVDMDSDLSNKENLTKFEAAVRAAAKEKVGSR